jgi:WD40 repeat protein
VLRFLAVLAAVILTAGLILWWMGALHFLTATVPTADAAEEPLLTNSADRVPVPPRARTSPAPDGATAGATWLPDPVRVAGCNLSPVREQDISSQVDGVFQRITVRLGSPVVRGQLLGRLESSKVRMMVEQYRLKADSELAEKLARARYDEAKARVQSDETISREATGGVAQAQYRVDVLQRDQMRLEIEKAHEDTAAARLELRRARRELELHDIQAAFAGEVVKLYKRNGEAVKQWEPAFRVADFNRLRVEGLLPADQAGVIRPGMRALVAPELAGRPVTELRGHTAAVTGLAVSPDGRWLASASEDRTAVLWSAVAGTRRAVLEHAAEVHAVALAAQPPGDGRGPGYLLLTGAGDGRARLWVISALGHVAEDPAELTGQHQGPVRTVAISPDGRRCATGGEDSRIALWDTAKRRYLYSVRAKAGDTAHRGAVTMVHFAAPDRLVTAGRDNVLRVWHLGAASATLTSEHRGRTGDVPQPGVAADGRRLLFDHGDELRILDADTGAGLGALQSDGHGQFQDLAVFSASGALVLTAGTNGRLQLWRTPATRDDAAFLRQGYQESFYRNSLSALGVLGAALAPSGHVLSPTWSALAVAAPGCGTARPQSEERSGLVPRLWAPDATEVRHLVTPDASSESCGVFTPDEKGVFTAGSDQVIRLWAVPPAAETSQPLEAEVTFVGSQLESGTGLVRIRAEVDNPRDPARRLRPGTHVTLLLYPEAGARP